MIVFLYRASLPGCHRKTVYGLPDIWHVPPYSICAQLVERQCNRKRHEKCGEDELNATMSYTSGVTKRRFRTILTLCIRTYGFGPKHVSQTIGKSLRSQPSASGSCSKRCAICRTKFTILFAEAELSSPGVCNRFTSIKLRNPAILLL